MMMVLMLLMLILMLVILLVMVMTMASVVSAAAVYIVDANAHDVIASVTVDADGANATIVNAATDDYIVAKDDDGNGLGCRF